MKFEDFKKFIDLAKMGMDATVSISDWRARRRIERRKALDDEKDKRIKELEKELAALKGKNGTTPAVNLGPASASDSEPARELHPEGDEDDDCIVDDDGDADEE